jgi:predicted O-methyltransferase YrrM
LFLELYPEAEALSVPMGEVAYRWSNINPMEAYCLSAVALLRQPRTIFEFGTFDGATARRLAELLPSAEIFTIDLPDSISESAARGRRTGELLDGVPNVTQLTGDSRTFDFSAFTNRVDLVIVDAGHSFDCVLSDTQSALRMLTTDGVVIWDDYSPAWTDVVRVVDETAAAGHPIFKIAETACAILDPALIPGRTSQVA